MKGLHVTLSTVSEHADSEWVVPVTVTAGLFLPFCDRRACNYKSQGYGRSKGLLKQEKLSKNRTELTSSWIDQRVAVWWSCCAVFVFDINATSKPFKICRLCLFRDFIGVFLAAFKAHHITNNRAEISKGWTDYETLSPRVRRLGENEWTASANNHYHGALCPSVSTNFAFSSFLRSFSSRLSAHTIPSK